ncbi:MAG: hypothetical protein LBS49_08845 [Candidatus Accumulibacter sp.]|nr:hypothetical protein [Accumulibacter sp.]
MTHSLRSLFRLMLLAWFALAALMAFALSIHFPSEAAGTLVENLFTRVPPPPAAKLLPAAPARPAVREAPRPIRVAPPPAVEETPPSPWRELEYGRKGGKGALGAAEISARPTGEIEIVFPFRGEAGQASFYRLERKGSLSVDLHGELRLAQTVNAVLEHGFLQRLQIYPHPGFIRISGMGRTRDLLPRMTARAFVAENRLRVVFSLAGKSPQGPQSPQGSQGSRESPRVGEGS